MHNNAAQWVSINGGAVRVYKYREFSCSNVPFEVWNRYTDPKFIGQGAYGAVISATDLQLPGQVAIKKILDIQVIVHPRMWIP